MRADDEATDALLRRLLADHVEPSIAAEHVNYSIRIEHPPRSGDGGVGTPLHSSYDGGCLLARDRDPGPVIGALLRHLDRHGAREQTFPVVAAVALRRRDGSLVLVSAIVRRWAAKRRRWLAAKGLELLPTPIVLLAEEPGEVIVPGVSLRVDLGCLADLGVDRRELEDLEESWRAPVTAWVLASVEGDFEPASRAAAVEAALAAVVQPGAGGPRGVVAALSDTMRAAVPIGVRGLHRNVVVERLPRLA